MSGSAELELIDICTPDELAARIDPGAEAVLSLQLSVFDDSAELRDALLVDGYVNLSLSDEQRAAVETAVRGSDWGEVAGAMTEAYGLAIADGAPRTEAGDFVDPPHAYFRVTFAPRAELQP